MEDVIDWISKILQLASGLGSMGPTGWIATGILVLVVGVAGWFIWRKIQQQRIDESNKQNDERREQSERQLPKQVSELERSMREGQSILRRKIADIAESRLKDKIIWLKIETPVHGPYRTASKLPKGAVIHYTAGVAVNNIESAKAVLSDMASRGYGAYLIGNDGMIYAPEVMGLKEHTFHAGSAQWKGEKDLNSLCMGIEVTCAGKLDQGHTWWGLEVQKGVIRSVDAVDNMAAGEYMAFTESQEASIVALLLWHIRNNPDFDIDWIVGHDEIAPTRKTDPGGSLSLTMPAFREMMRRISGGVNGREAEKPA